MEVVEDGSLASIVQANNNNPWLFIISVDSWMLAFLPI